MPISGKDAVAFVSPRFQSKQIRNYAVSDFLLYNDIASQGTTPAELQKTWALYLKWKALADANKEYFSANGTAFKTSVKFFYTEGGDTKTPPTLVSAKGSGTKEAELKGVGQCEYFADLAYGNLKTPATGGKAGPLVQKIATPGHNWVRVNGDAADVKDVVYVDYWLFALGVPATSCVCLSASSIVTRQALINMTPIKVIKTWNPNTLKESLA